jgi:hypothetical protein
MWDVMNGLLNHLISPHGYTVNPAYVMHAAHYARTLGKGGESLHTATLLHARSASRRTPPSRPLVRASLVAQAHAHAHITGNAAPQ